MSQLVCVRFDDVEQNEAVTGVVAEKANILSSPAAEICNALLILAPVDVNPGVWGSPVIGLKVLQRALANKHEVTFV